MQTIQYQVVTLLTTNGQAPFVTVFMYLGEAKNEQEKDDLALIIEETLLQRYQGVKNEKGVWVTPAFPKLIYVLEEDNIREGTPYWYLTELAAKCTAKRMVPDYISEKKMLELKVDKNGKGHCYPCMGCRSFTDALCGTPRTRAGSPSTTAASTRASSPSTCRTWRCPPAAIWRNSGSIFDERLELCHRALHVPPRAAEGHPVRRRAHPVAVRRLRPAEEGRAHRQAALRRLLHHLPGLCGPVRVREVHDRQEPHRPGGHALCAWQIMQQHERRTARSGRRQRISTSPCTARRWSPPPTSSPSACRSASASSRASPTRATSPTATTSTSPSLSTPLTSWSSRPSSSTCPPAAPSAMWRCPTCRTIWTRCWRS